LRPSGRLMLVIDVCCCCFFFVAVDYLFVSRVKERSRPKNAESNAKIAKKNGGKISKIIEQIARLLMLLC